MERGNRILKEDLAVNIAVCDDDNMWIAHIEEYIAKIKEIYKETEYDTYTSGEALMQHYEKNGNTYDIVILDIEMNNITGIEVAHKIRDRDSAVCIFFLTNHKEYVYECFKPAPMNFWIKPVEYEVFKEDMMRAYKCIDESSDYIKIIENRKRIRLKCDEILYIENKDRKSWLYTVSGIHKTNKLLSDLMKDLDNKIFVRVYKSFIINLRHVHIINEDYIKLYNSDEEIPISRTYKKELIDKYINLKERGSF